jgi:hypothetical protein
VADDGRGGSTTWLGRYDPRTHRFEEQLLPVSGYVHVGFDPAGMLDFVEHAAADRHEMLTVHRGSDPAAPLELRVLRRLRSPATDNQRDHAHPFLSPDRTRLYFTDWSEDGFSQICSMDVSDLTS